MIRDSIRFPEKPPWLQLDRNPKKKTDRQRLLCVVVRRSRVRMTMMDT